MITPELIKARLAELRFELTERTAHIEGLKAEMRNEENQINCCMGAIQALDALLKETE